MERTKNESILEEMIPQLEAEHDQVPEEQTRLRAAIWSLIEAVETYLLTKDEERKSA